MDNNFVVYNCYNVILIINGEFYMQIEYKKGDILESDSQALVNAVNCVGIMGAGLAKQFKTKYPNMYKHYKDSCNKGYLSIGKLCCFKEKNKIIINFPTKIH